MEPKMPTSEEMAKIQESRTESDAELIKGGAKYIADEKGDMRLDMTEDQKGMLDENRENEVAYMEKVMKSRFDKINQGFEYIQQQMEYVKEKTDYKAMTKNEFSSFENSYAILNADIASAAYNFFNEKNDMKVTHEDWDIWVSQNKGEKN